MVADVDAAGVTTVGVVGLGIMGSAMSGLPPRCATAAVAPSPTSPRWPDRRR